LTVLDDAGGHHADESQRGAVTNVQEWELALVASRQRRSPQNESDSALQLSEPFGRLHPCVAEIIFVGFVCVSDVDRQLPFLVSANSSLMHHHLPSYASSG